MKRQVDNHSAILNLRKTKLKIHTQAAGQTEVEEWEQKDKESVGSSEMEEYRYLKNLKYLNLREFHEKKEALKAMAK